MTKTTSLTDIKGLQARGFESLYPNKPKIAISMASCGLAAGANKIYETVMKEVKEQNLDWIITELGCIGFCQKEPLLYFHYPGQPKLFYGDLTEKKNN